MQEALSSGAYLPAAHSTHASFPISAFAFPTSQAVHTKLGLVAVGVYPTSHTQNGPAADAAGSLELLAGQVWQDNFVPSLYSFAAHSKHPTLPGSGPY